MLFTTKFQVGSGSHTPFVFKQLETPPKHPCGQPCVEDPEHIQMQTANIRHNPLYSFENPFGTPCETPKGENSLVPMVHLDEVQHYLEEKVHKNQRIIEAMCAREKEHQQVEYSNHTCHEGKKWTCSQNPFDGNDGNNTPQRTPRVTMGAYALPIMEVMKK